MEIGLREYKIRASLLLKSLCSADPARSHAAAARFQRALPELAGRSVEAVLSLRDSLQHKHALAAVAHEAGHASWTELKAALGEKESPRFEPEMLFAHANSAFLNRWFSTYAAARASLEAEGGFLFPFRTQFFVCCSEFLRARRIDVSDPDWEGIGFDWVKPANGAARARLEQKLLQLGFGRHS